MRRQQIKIRLAFALSALAMITLMFVTSCKKDDPAVPNPPITIPEEFTTLSLESSAYRKAITFTATTDWDVTLDETTKGEPNWLTVSPMSGSAGSVNLKINVEKNTIDKERSSVVQINAGGEQYTITVNQKAGELEEEGVTGVTLNESTLSLVVGKSETLTATIAPENAANQNVTWESSDSEVATVEDGKVTAVKVGTATITVTTEDGEKTATCEVTVTASVVEVKSVSLNKTATSLVEGTTETLTATIAPENATNKNVTWESSDSEVATVEDGKVTAVKAGSATITVTTEDGDKIATCEVTVTASAVEVTSVSLNKTATSLVEGTTETLVATVNPSNATNKNVTWESSDSEVATVEDGKVTAVKAGSATITVTTEDGDKIATCEVTVTASTVEVTSVSLNKTSTSLVEGTTETLVATVNPSNASNKNVIWASSNTDVATVVDGEVTAVGVGSATITVTTEDGEKTATCEVSVTASAVAVTGVTLNQEMSSMTIGATKTLTATVAPSNATNKNVEWTSGNTAVATVANGVVTAVGAGITTITVTTEDGAKTATCSISVKKPLGTAVTGVTISPSGNFELVIGATKTLSATVAPSDASNKNVEWTSSNTAVATVVDGEVTAVGAGSATITVTTEDGGKTATCEVSVTEEVSTSVTGVTLNKTSFTLIEGNTVTLEALVAPSTAINKNVTWESSNTDAATVVDGVVTAVKLGSATITVTTEDGGKTATCEVTVMAKAVTPVVTSVTLNKTNLSLDEGESETLTATVSPSSVMNKSVTWESSDTAVATVANGVVTAVKAGSATITVTTISGGKTASCEVEVSAKFTDGSGLDDFIQGEW